MIASHSTTFDSSAAQGGRLSSHWNNASARVPKLSRLHRQALSSFQQGHLEKVERLCTGILEYRHDDFDALQLLGLLEARGGMRVRLRSARLENEFPGEEEVLPDGTTETVFVHWELQETPMTEKKAKRFLRDSKCDFILLRRKQ